MNRSAMLCADTPPASGNNTAASNSLSNSLIISMYRVFDTKPPPPRKDRISRPENLSCPVSVLVEQIRRTLSFEPLRIAAPARLDLIGRGSVDDHAAHPVDADELLEHRSEKPLAHV